MSYGNPPPPGDDRTDPTQNPDEPNQGYGSPPPPPPQYGTSDTSGSGAGSADEPRPGYDNPPPPPPPSGSGGYQSPPAGGGYEQQQGGYQQQPGYQQQGGGYQQTPSDSGSYPPPPPPAYGQQGQQGQQGYGAAPAYTGPYEQNQVGTLAQWPQRALGWVIDFIALNIPAYILYAIGAPRVDPNTGLATAPNIFYYLGFLYSLGFVYIYNRWYRGGTTGQTIGRGVAGVKVVKESNGEVLGMGMAFVRDLAHIVDSLICYIGWLFPLWDQKRQTLADKIMSTVSITAPKN